VWRFASSFSTALRFPAFSRRFAPVCIAPPNPLDAASLLSFENSSVRRHIPKLSHRIPTFNSQVHHSAFRRVKPGTIIGRRVGGEPADERAFLPLRILQASRRQTRPRTSPASRGPPATAGCPAPEVASIRQSTIASRPQHVPLRDAGFASSIYWLSLGMSQGWETEVEHRRRRSKKSFCIHVSLLLRLDQASQHAAVVEEQSPLCAIKRHPDVDKSISHDSWSLLQPR
jgi:hypothetical protein